MMAIDSPPADAAWAGGVDDDCTGAAGAAAGFVTDGVGIFATGVGATFAAGTLAAGAAVLGAEAVPVLRGAVFGRTALAVGEGAAGAAAPWRNPSFA
jgi:hypothetical protein